MDSLHKTCNTKEYQIFDPISMQRLCQSISLHYETSNKSSIIRDNQISVIRDKINNLLDQLTTSKITTSSQYVQSIDCSIKLYENIQKATECVEDNMIFCTEYHKAYPNRTNLYYVLDNALQEFPYVWWHVCMFMDSPGLFNSGFKSKLSTQHNIECAQWSNKIRIGTDANLRSPITLIELLRYDAGITGMDISKARSDLYDKVNNQISNWQTYDEVNEISVQLASIKIGCWENQVYKQLETDKCKKNILKWNFEEDHDPESFAWTVKKTCFENGGHTVDPPNVNNENDSPAQHIANYFSKTGQWLHDYNFLSYNNQGLLLVEIKSDDPFKIMDVRENTPIDVIDSLVYNNTAANCIFLDNTRHLLSACGKLSASDLRPLKTQHCESLYEQYTRLLKLYSAPGPLTKLACDDCKYQKHGGLNEHVKNNLEQLLVNWKGECYQNADQQRYLYKPLKLPDLTSPAAYFNDADKIADFAVEANHGTTADTPDEATEGFKSEYPELQASGFTVVIPDTITDNNLVSLQLFKTRVQGYDDIEKLADKTFIDDGKIKPDGKKIRLSLDKSPLSKSMWIDTGNRFLNAAIKRVTLAGITPTTWSVLNARNPNPSLTLSETGQYMMDHELIAYYQPRTCQNIFFQQYCFDDGERKRNPYDWLPSTPSQASRNQDYINEAMSNLKKRFQMVGIAQVNEALKTLLEEILGPVHWKYHVIDPVIAPTIENVCIPKEKKLTVTDFFEKKSCVSEYCGKTGLTDAEAKFFYFECLKCSLINQVDETENTRYCFKTKVPKGFFNCTVENNVFLKKIATNARSSTDKILSSVSKQESMFTVETRYLLTDAELLSPLKKYRKTVYTVFIDVLRKLTQNNDNGIFGKLSSLQMFQDYYSTWHGDETEIYESFNIESEKKFDEFIKQFGKNCPDTNNLPVIDYLNCSSEFMHLYNAANDMFDGKMRKKTNVIVPKQRTGVWPGVPFSQHFNTAIPAWSQAFKSGLCVLELKILR